MSPFALREPFEQTEKISNHDLYRLVKADINHRRNGTTDGSLDAGMMKREPSRSRTSAYQSSGANAAVLSVPVWAMPITSRPRMTAGIVFVWIGAGEVLCLGECKTARATWTVDEDVFVSRRR